MMKQLRCQTLVVGFRRITKLWCLFAIILGLLSVGPRCAIAAGAKTSPVITIAEYKVLVSTLRDKVRSLRVQYTTDLTGDAAVVKAGRLKGVVTQDNVVFAFSGKKRFAAVQSVGSFDTGAKYNVERVTAFDGNECRRRENKSLDIQATKSPESEQNAYTNSLGWPIADEEIALCKSAPAKSPFLPFFLDDSTWEVLPEPQLLSEVSCVVLSKLDHSHKLYLDPSRHFTLIRSEQLAPTRGVRKWIFEFGDLKEDLPGLFLPRSLRTTHELIDVTSEAYIGEMQINMKVHELSINNIPDEQFVLLPMSGETVFDGVLGSNYKFYPGNSQPLGRGGRQMTPKMLEKWSAGVTLLFGVSVSALTIILGWAAVKILRQRSAKS